MFCIHCGTTLKPGTKFCIECGGASTNASVASDTAAAQATPIAAAPVMPAPAAAKPAAQQPKAAPAAVANRTGLIAAAAVLGVAVLAGVGFVLTNIQSGSNPLSALLGNLQPEKLPQTYGLFVWNGIDWVELGKDKPTIEIDIAEAPKFLIHGKGIERLTQSFALRRMYFVRNTIAQDRDGSKKAIEKTVRTWGLKENAEPIEGRFAPVKGNPEMVMWIPAAKLGPGAYLPSLSRQNLDAFFVSKNSFMGELAGSEHCLDRIVTRRTPIQNAMPVQYAACSLNTAQADSSGNTSSQTVEVPWFGKWAAPDGRKTLTFSATKLDVVEAFQGGGEHRDQLKWIGGLKISEGQFGQPGKRTSKAELTARYQTALNEFKKGNSDYTADALERTRQAIALLTLDSYQIVTGHAEGHCRIWDWLLNNDFIVEISDCKYGFHAQVLNRAK